MKPARITGNFKTIRQNRTLNRLALHEAECNGNTGETKSKPLSNSRCILNLLSAVYSARFWTGQGRPQNPCESLKRALVRSYI
jgi:hypothetical protein